MALVVLSVAIACDWFAAELRQANDQYDARLWVASVEGQIFFEDEIESALEAHRPPNAVARPIEAPFGFDWLRGLIDRDFCANVVECGLENHFRVHGVHFSSGDEEDNIRPKVTANGIKLLGRLPNLQRLTLESYKIEVNWLKDLKTLRELCLVDRRPDERRIAELKSIMPNTKIFLLGE
jgi:hypothetical protein